MCVSPKRSGLGSCVSIWGLYSKLGHLWSSLFAQMQINKQKETARSPTDKNTHRRTDGRTDGQTIQYSTNYKPIKLQWAKTDNRSIPTIGSYRWLKIKQIQNVSNIQHELTAINFEQPYCYIDQFYTHPTTFVQQKNLFYNSLPCSVLTRRCPDNCPPPRTSTPHRTRQVLSWYEIRRQNSACHSGAVRTALLFRKDSAPARSLEVTSRLLWRECSTVHHSADLRPRNSSELNPVGHRTPIAKTTWSFVSLRSCDHSLIFGEVSSVNDPLTVGKHSCQHV